MPTGDVPQPREINREDREDRAKLNQDDEGLAERIVVEAEEALHQQQMSGGGDRNELGEPFDDSQNEGLEEIERHADIRCGGDLSGAPL